MGKLNAKVRTKRAVKFNKKGKKALDPVIKGRYKQKTAAKAWANIQASSAKSGDSAPATEAPASAETPLSSRDVADFIDSLMDEEGVTLDDFADSSDEIGGAGTPREEPHGSEEADTRAAHGQDSVEDASSSEGSFDAAAVAAAEAEHSATLAALAESDPKFYQFLQHEDAGLLDFGASAHVDADAEAAEEEEDEVEGGDSAEQPDAKVALSSDGVSAEMLRVWIANALTPGASAVRGLRRLVEAWKGIARVHDTRAAVKPSRYPITQADAFEELLSFCVHQVRAAFDLVASSTPARGSTSVSAAQRKAMGVSEIRLEDGTTAVRVEDPTAAPAWEGVLAPMAEMFLRYLAFFLANLQDPAMAAMVAKSAESMAVYAQASAAVTRQLIKSLTAVLGGSASQSLDVDHASSGTAATGHKKDAAEGVRSRVAAFMALRSLSSELPQPVHTNVCKGVYMVVVRAGTRGVAAGSSTVKFLQSCLIELLGMESSIAYTLGFVYIRQLAILLRSAVMDRKAEQRAAVLSWKYITSVRTWASAVAKLAPEHDEVAQLVYPLTQLLYGVIRLTPSTRWLPLRFHTIRALNEVSRAMYPGTIIATAPLLVEALGVPEFSRDGARKHRHAGTQRKFEMDSKLFASPSAAKSATFADACLQQIEELLLDNMALMSNNIAFPELALPVVVGLNKFCKSAYSAAARSTMSDLAKKVQAVLKAVQRRRAVAGLVPAKLEQCVAFEGEQGTNPLQTAHQALAAHRARQAGVAEQQRASEAREVLAKRGRDAKGTKEEAPTKRTKQSKTQQEPEQAATEEKPQGKKDKKDKKADKKDKKEDKKDNKADKKDKKEDKKDKKEDKKDKKEDKKEKKQSKKDAKKEKKQSKKDKQSATSVKGDVAGKSARVDPDGDLLMELDVSE